MKILKYITIIASIILLNSCDNKPQYIPYNETSIKVNNILETTKNGEKYSSAPLATQNILGSYITTFENDIESTDFLYENQKILYSDNEWVEETPISLNASKKFNLYCYSPYNETATTDNNDLDINISSDQSTNAKLLSNDFLWSKNSITQVSDFSDININMNHVTSKIVVKIYAGSGFESGFESALGENPTFKIRFKNSLKNGTLNLKTGIATTKPNSLRETEMLPYIIQDGNGLNENPKICEIIVLPQKKEIDLDYLEITINDKLYHLENTHTEFNYEAGNQYVYSLKLSNAGFEFISKNITDWNLEPHDVTHEAKKKCYSLNCNSLNYNYKTFFYGVVPSNSPDEAEKPLVNVKKTILTKSAVIGYPQAEVLIAYPCGPANSPNYENKGIILHVYQEYNSSYNIWIDMSGYGVCGGEVVDGTYVRGNRYSIKQFYYYHNDIFLDWDSSYDLTPIEAEIR